MVIQIDNIPEKPLVHHCYPVPRSVFNKLSRPLSHLFSLSGVRAMFINKATGDGD